MKITILGTGALGIAMAKSLHQNTDFEIVMWTKFENERDLLTEKRENDILLPNVKLSEDIFITSNLDEAINGSYAIMNCLPFVAIKDVANDLKDVYNGQFICSTTKGIDINSFKTTTEIFSEILNTDKVCALSGPSFAIEIANEQPIFFVLAGKNKQAVDCLYDILKNSNMYIEKSNDDIGVQLCGAVKNAVAIGCGMLYGMNSADSTKAAYLARGMKDISKVITSLGGQEKTIATYAGVGDLILTCTSPKSRNHSFGKLLGEGNTLSQAIEKLNGKTVEGIRVIESITNYMLENNLELDTIPKLYNIIFKGQDIKTIERI